MKAYGNAYAHNQIMCHIERAESCMTEALDGADDAEEHLNSMIILLSQDRYSANHGRFFEIASQLGLSLSESKEHVCRGLNSINMNFSF